MTARVPPESRRSAHAVRRALAALDYQETINFSFVEARWEHELAGNADPIARAQPDRGAAGGDALEPDRQPGGQVLRYNLARRAARVRVFEIGRVFRRDAAVRDG